MSKKSLASVLRLQWWLHTLLTSIFFISVTFFFLFVIEDYFHEKQLSELSNIVAINHSIEGMPSHIQLYSVTDVPQAWLTQLEQVSLNDAIEIDNAQGEAVHLVRSTFSKSEEVFILALDTGQTNSIWDIADKLTILILPWVIIFLALASFLAKKFTRQIQSHFKRLLITIEQSESPNDLKLFSETQSITELAKFAQLFSEVWQQKIEILNREKQSLEYLSHEIRTPIQSSLATLELLALTTDDKKTIDRLMRSLNRMTRLSNAILYLMESEKLLTPYQVDVFTICQQLVDELTPLAQVKNQSFVMNVNTDDPVMIMATQEVIETLLSILLTNALHYSDKSPIIINITHYHVSIENDLKQRSQVQSSSNNIGEQQGFGIGLTIAQRLANKFNLQLALSFNTESKGTATISNSNSNSNS